MPKSSSKATNHTSSPRPPAASPPAKKAKATADDAVPAAEHQALDALSAGVIQEQGARDQQRALLEFNYYTRHEVFRRSFNPVVDPALVSVADLPRELQAQFGDPDGFFFYANNPAYESLDTDYLRDWLCRVVDVPGGKKQVVFERFLEPRGVTNLSTKKQMDRKLQKEIDTVQMTYHGRRGTMGRRGFLTPPGVLSEVCVWESTAVKDVGELRQLGEDAQGTYGMEKHFFHRYANNPEEHCRKRDSIMRVIGLSSEATPVIARGDGAEDDIPLVVSCTPLGENYQVNPLQVLFTLYLEFLRMALPVRMLQEPKYAPLARQAMPYLFRRLTELNKTRGGKNVRADGTFEAETYDLLRQDLVHMKDLEANETDEAQLQGSFHKYSNTGGTYYLPDPVAVGPNGKPRLTLRSQTKFAINLWFKNSGYTKIAVRNMRDDNQLPVDERVARAIVAPGTVASLKAYVRFTFHKEASGMFNTRMQPEEVFVFDTSMKNRRGGSLLPASTGVPGYKKGRVDVGALCEPGPSYPLLLSSASASGPSVVELSPAELEAEEQLAREL